MSMLKSVISTLGITAKSGYNISSNPACVQCVRWRRKPRWLPIAKSRVFRVPERKQQDPDERAELFRLHNNYKTQVRAVRSYLIEEYQIKSRISSADHLVITPEEEQAEYEACLRENDKWNAGIAIEREKRLEREMAEKREWVLERLQLKEEREHEARLAADEKIRREKELSKTYILKENLDQAIEHALANPVDFNFAIDLEGNMYGGRNSVAAKTTSVIDGTKKATENAAN